MAIKYTLLGMLIYAAMGCYLVTFKLAQSRLRGFSVTGVVLFALGCLTGLAYLTTRYVIIGHSLLQLILFIAFIALVVLGLLFFPLPLRRTPVLMAKAFFGIGCLVALMGVVLRTIEVKHPPLQNMFEVCLFMAAMIFPLSMFCRRFLGSPNLAADAMIGFVILFPVGFVFPLEALHLPPALQSGLFIPHVTSYLLSYPILWMAAVPGVVLLIRGQKTPSQEAVLSPGQHSHEPQPDLEKAVYNLVCLGFPLLTLGLVLGAVWGKYAWGDYWNWDPKELMSLATFLAYVLYLHARYMLGPRPARLYGGLVLVGGILIVVTLIVVNLSRYFQGMHSYASS